MPEFLDGVCRGATVAVMVVAALTLGVAHGTAETDFDRLIGMNNQSIPEVFATPATVTLASTGIECVALPCPYWQVEDAGGGLLIGVERVVASPDDDGVDLENALWAYLRAHDHAPVAVEGYVLDRQRTRGAPPMQRVLFILSGPFPTP